MKRAEEPIESRRRAAPAPALCAAYAAGCLFFDRVFPFSRLDMFSGTAQPVKAVRVVVEGRIVPIQLLTELEGPELRQAPGDAWLETPLRQAAEYLRAHAPGAPPATAAHAFKHPELNFAASLDLFEAVARWTRWRLSPPAAASPVLEVSPDAVSARAVVHGGPIVLETEPLWRGRGRLLQ